MWVPLHSKVEDLVRGHHPSLGKAQVTARMVKRGAILQHSEQVKHQSRSCDPHISLSSQFKVEHFQTLQTQDTHDIVAIAAGMKRHGRGGFGGPQRTISVKDVINALEREPQMMKSRLIYQLYERLPGDSTTD
jgi:hypothetical protein